MELNKLSLRKGKEWEEIYNKMVFLTANGVVAKEMAMLDNLIKEVGTKRFINMLSHGGDVNGMVASNENVESWFFPCPFNTEQEYVFIFPCEKGGVAVSGDLSDVPGFIADLWLDNEYEEWREREFCRVS